jgi:hypothetical protein
LILRPHDATSLYGFRGTGKTVAGRHLARLIAERWHGYKGHQTFVLYTKLEDPFPFARRFFPGVSYQYLCQLDGSWNAGADVVVVQPRVWEMTRDWFDLFFYHLWLRCTRGRKRYATLYVDEIDAVTGGKANGGPFYFRMCYTQGRGIHLGIIAGKQDATFIQRETLSQVNHVLAFWTRSVPDLEKLSVAMAIEIPRDFPDPYGFYYAGGREPARYFASIGEATGVDPIL